MSENPAQDTQLEEYKGNCHCGAFQFSLKTQPVKRVQVCNCSICARNGYMWLKSVPDDHFIIRKGEGTLKEYEFGNRTVTHMFCPRCGTSVMARWHSNPKGRDIGLNVRTLMNIDLAALEIEHFNGAENAVKIYNGHCHCGKICYTVKSVPLDHIGVLSCNCSLCLRNGDLWIYPKKTDMIIKGWDELTDYAFLNENSLHSFCDTCGVSILVKILDNGKGDEICPINVRAIKGIDLDQLKMKKYDGAKNDPQYIVPL